MVAFRLVKAFFWEAKQSWAVDVPAKLSPTGKRQRKLFPTRDKAREFAGDKKGEHNELGRSGVTAEQREWINYAENELGELTLLPDVIRHWKRTGTGAIKPTLVSDAVEAFKVAQLKRVSDRTKSDIRWRLKAFAEHFKGRQMHQIHAGEIETWIDSHAAAWSRRSFYKRLRPLFAHGVRHRWLAEDPIKLLKAPETPSASKAVYTGKQFNDLLDTADVADTDYLLPFLALSGFAWIRTSEMVRLYSSEQVLCWEDIEWNRERIHIREEVGKATRRASGNERWIPMDKHLLNWLSIYKGKHAGPIVPDMHNDFSEAMRKLHTAADVTAIHNGLRRSAISHYLAAHPETGIGQLARWAGTSEATIKRHYLESLTPEAGAEWFKIGRPAAK